jgi:hypothetical protein
VVDRANEVHGPLIVKFRRLLYARAVLLTTNGNEAVQLERSVIEQARNMP